MEMHYNQQYTRAEIDQLLVKIKHCIVLGRYAIAQNERRQENIDFLAEYNIQRKKREQILLGIKVEDFCHSLRNTKPGFEHEVLFVFAPQVELYGTENQSETVVIYVKFNLIERMHDDYTVVISFHRLGRPINYAFR